MDLKVQSHKPNIEMEALHLQANGSPIWLPLVGV